MRIHSLAVTLAALTFVPALQAQQVSGGPDPERKASTFFISNDSHETLAGVFISYSPAEWQESYNDMLATLAGSNYTRLGKGWWTSFETVGTVEIGGTKIEAGSYFLGLAVDKDGAFSLLVFDSKHTLKAGLLPSTTALYTGEARPETKAPLTLAKDSLKEHVVKLEVEIAADKKDPASGRFSIRWGKHELSAPLKFHLAGAKASNAPKK
ncbi:MAG TPA: hypothetical protein VF384_16365 [Planctomycetota bacterium]